MEAIDRCSVQIAMLCGAGVATVGSAAIPRVAKSAPLATSKEGIVQLPDLVEEVTRVTVTVQPRRRRHHRRHWRCWWQRGVWLALIAGQPDPNSSCSTAILMGRLNEF